MSSIRQLTLTILAALVALTLPPPVSAGPPLTTTATQTIRTLKQDQNGIQGDYLVSYSSLTLRSVDWTLRGSVSMLSWRDGNGPITIPNDHGPGSFHLTAGRRLWWTRSGSRISSGWIRLRGKIPLQEEFDVTGSGETDWGASLFTSHRLGMFSVLAEAGVMNLGDPVGIEYDALVSGSLSLSYRRPGDRIYPIVGYSAASPAQSDDPAYGEWTLGVGVIGSHGMSMSALYSRGVTKISPVQGFAVSASMRMGR